MLSPTNLKSDTITLISDFMDIYKIEISDEYKQIAKFSFGIKYIGSALYYAFVKEVEINNYVHFYMLQTNLSLYIVNPVYIEMKSYF